MRVFAFVLALNTAVAAGVAHAQAPAPAGQAPAAPRPTAPAPQTPAAPRPVAPAPVVQAPPQPRFQDGLKYAWVNIQLVAAHSAEGKVAAEKIKALQEQKTRELQDKNKALQANQQKLEQGGSVMSEQARAQLQAEIEKQQRDINRFSEDAQQDVQTLAEQVELDFNRKVIAVVGKVAQQKQVHFVFNGTQSGLIWADAGLDLTAEVIQAFDAPAPAAAPSAAAPTPTTPAPTAPAPAAPTPR